jgi:O-antigen biosynthesis protein WbqP
MYYPLKRLLDLLFSLVMLIVLFPLFLLIGILIKLESPGPIFFKQKRYGCAGSYFSILKFRSMKVGTPNLATDLMENPQQYVTRVGGFMRKTSLDELPQLINILLGDMSFVGPRPALYNQYELIQARIASKVDSILPGLTGYAQIMGRDNISDNQKIAYDKYYLDHRSLQLDFKIIYLTFFKVVRAENIRE